MKRNKEIVYFGTARIQQNLLYRLSGCTIIKGFVCFESSEIRKVSIPNPSHDRKLLNVSVAGKVIFDRHCSSAEPR